MRIGSGLLSYEWIEDWATPPDTESGRAGWAHGGIAVTGVDEVIAFHPGEPVVLVFDLDGNLKRTWEAPVTDAHGMSIVHEGGEEFLWVADNGVKKKRQAGYEYPQGNRRGQVVKLALDGRTMLHIQVPGLDLYREGSFSPTGVAVYLESRGGNGDIWFADGYGERYVHRYDRAGTYVASLNGEGGAGPFNSPHGVWIDTRKNEPELYVADRPIQVYDIEGNFKRAFGTEFLTSPRCFATDGELLFVPELRARIAVFDDRDGFVGYLGENEEVCEIEGWPNSLDQRARPIRSTLLEAGKFNSPHGIAVDRQGNLYVTEWLIGGRFTKLARY